MHQHYIDLNPHDDALIYPLALMTREIEFFLILQRESPSDRQDEALTMTPMPR